MHEASIRPEMMECICAVASSYCSASHPAVWCPIFRDASRGWPVCGSCKRCSRQSAFQFQFACIPRGRPDAAAFSYAPPTVGSVEQLQASQQRSSKKHHAARNGDKPFFSCLQIQNTYGCWDSYSHPILEPSVVHILPRCAREGSTG